MDTGSMDFRPSGLEHLWRLSHFFDHKLPRSRRMEVHAANRVVVPAFSFLYATSSFIKKISKQGFRIDGEQPAGPMPVVRSDPGHVFGVSGQVKNVSQYSHHRFPRTAMAASTRAMPASAA